MVGRVSIKDGFCLYTPRKDLAGCDCVISCLDHTLGIEKLVPALADHETDSCRVRLVKVKQPESNQVVYGTRSNYSDSILSQLIVDGIARFIEFKGCSCSCDPVQTSRLTFYFTKALGSIEVPLCLPQQIAVN